MTQPSAADDEARGENPIRVTCGLTIVLRTRTLSAARAGRVFAINWNVTARNAPTVAMTDLSFIASPLPERASAKKAGVGFGATPR
jgi:hypothetical protein